jgi:hypothetical protein
MAASGKGVSAETLRSISSARPNPKAWNMAAGSRPFQVRAGTRSFASTAARVRVYSPLEPFFDKTWRPSEIETF